MGLHFVSRKIPFENGVFVIFLKLLYEIFSIRSVGCISFPPSPVGMHTKLSVLLTIEAQHLNLLIR